MRAENRLRFFTPRGGMKTEIIHGAILLVTEEGDTPTFEQIDQWTFYERILAYDWAMRVHLRASDSNIRVRERPTFTRPVKVAA